MVRNLDIHIVFVSEDRLKRLHRFNNLRGDRMTTEEEQRNIYTSWMRGVGVILILIKTKCKIDFFFIKNMYFDTFTI